MKATLLRLVLLALFLLSAAVQAQVRPQGDLYFVTGLPRGDFRANVDDPGFGLSVFGGLGFEGVPVVLGAELGFLIYGQEVRREPFSSTIPDVRVRVVTSNNIATGHLVLRLQPPRGAVQPYLDGLVGFKYFFTETRIESENRSDDEPIAASTNFDDAAPSYGVGGGVQVKLYGGYGERPRGHVQALNLTLGVRYLLGGEAEYLKRGSIERHRDGTLEYDVSRSKTDLLMPHLGVTLRF